MTREHESEFSTLDAPSQQVDSYALPLEEWNRVVAAANHLGQREAEEPFRRRMQTFLTASNQAFSSKR